jgi:hypothetical protein
MYFDADRNAYVDSESGNIVFQEGEAALSHEGIAVAYVEEARPTLDAFSQDVARTKNTDDFSPTIARPGIAGSRDGSYSRLASPDPSPVKGKRTHIGADGQHTIGASSHIGMSHGSTDADMSIEDQLVRMHMEGALELPESGDSANPGYWQDWSMASAMQAMEFDMMEEEQRPEEGPEEGDFNEKEYRASRSCRRQLVTVSAFLVVVQIALLVAMIQTDGYDSNNPVIGPPV